MPLWQSVLTVVALSCSATAHADFQTYEIAPQPLEPALIEFARKAHMSIDYSGVHLKGVFSSGTSGQLSKSAALRMLLRDTGFGFKILDESSGKIFKLPITSMDAVAPAPESQIAQGGAEPVIEDLVVTAAKRPSANFRLPVSVSAVSSTTIDDLGAYDFQSLSVHLAGVTTTNLGPGRNKIFVRGLSDGPFADRTQSMVGVYIDEAPINFNDTNPDIRLFDVDRIELIRGPQGTLYGAGSLGGIYRVITNKPDLTDTFLKTRAAFALTHGGGPTKQLDAVFNTPIVEDRLAFRLTTYTDVRGGYIDNIEPARQNINDLQIYGVRPALRWRLSDDWTVDSTVTLQSIDYEDSQYYTAGLGRDRRVGLVQEPYVDNFINAGLTIRGELGAAVLTSANTYVDRDIHETADASKGLPFLDELEGLQDGTLPPSNLDHFFGAEDFLDNFQQDAIAYFTRDNIQAFSHETRLQSKAGTSFEWLLGGFFLHRQQKMNSVLALAFDDEEALVALTQRRIETTSDIALFGEATYWFGDRFSLTAGVRYSHNILKLDYMSNFVLDEDTQLIEGSKTTDKLIPKVAARYQWSDDVQTYMQVSTGYRVGGLNINTPLEALVAADPDETLPTDVAADFQSDTLINFEIGAKTYWFDRRLSLNVSAFYVEWYDIQSDQISAAGFPYVTNVGHARNLGHEIEFAAFPLAGLEIRGSFFWNDSELLEDNAYLGIKAGDHLPAIAENSASVAALYEFPLNASLYATISADYSYIGKSALTFDEDHSPAMGQYGILNARVVISHERWRAGLYGQNLTDTRANTFSYGNSFTLGKSDQITPPRPRTLGIFLEYVF
ncbi:TonB-dependent receptor [Kordiimonas aestuarii]|uniref:TonB-dependent receptor n=1 Tax=Kordiimonas aestuarii TaxID=1005925 RepID=UPI0021CFB33F|nr:TonB-dependent receptor [Kordiimonas aestuarii]